MGYVDVQNMVDLTLMFPAWGTFHMGQLFEYYGGIKKMFLLKREMILIRYQNLRDVEHNPKKRYWDILTWSRINLHNWTEQWQY